MDVLKKKINELKLHIKSKSTDSSANTLKDLSEVAKLHSELGHAYVEFREYGAAAKTFEDSLNKLQTVYGESKPHPDISVVLLDLARAYNGEQNFKKGLRYANDALSMLKELYGIYAKIPEIARALFEIGVGLYIMRDYPLSIKYLRLSFDMLTDIHGEDAYNVEIASVLHMSGCSYAALFALDQAQTNLKKGLHMRKLIHGEGTNHPDIADSLDQLAGTYLYTKQLDHAKEHAMLALTMRRAYYGETTAHPDIAESLFHIGSIISLKAESYLNDQTGRNYAEEAKGNGMSYVTSNGPNCKVAHLLLDFSCTLVPVGQYSEAMVLAMEAYSMLTELFGKKAIHPVMADILIHMGTIHGQINTGDARDGSNHKNALRCFHEALTMLLTLYGKDAVHPDVSRVYISLGEEYQDINDYNASLSYYGRALRILLHLYGSEDHRQVKTIKRRMNSVEKHTGSGLRKKKANRKAEGEYRSEPKLAINPRWQTQNGDGVYDTYVAEQQFGNSFSSDGSLDAITEMKNLYKMHLGHK